MMEPTNTGMIAFITVMVFCLIVPFCAGLIIAYKKKSGFLPLFIGAATFLVFQVLTRMPLLSAISAFFPALQAAVSGGGIGYWAYVAALCFSAGLFEETGRYIAMRFILKKNRGMWQGVVFGIGHGGFEAFILVGLNYLIYMIMNFIPEIAAQTQIPTAETVVASAMPFNIWMAGLERLTAIIFHTAMSMVIMRMVMSGKNWLYVVLPIAAHGIFNLIPQIMISTGFNIASIELALCAVSLLTMAATLSYWRAAPEAAMSIEDIAAPEVIVIDEEEQNQ